MERLTDKHFNKSLGYYIKCSGNCSKEDFSCEDCEEFDALVDRLGTIEDILGDDYDLDRLRELVEADQLIGKELWLTQWWTPNVQLVNAPIRRTVVYFSVCKNKSILLHFKDGALPLRLVGDCAYKTREAAESALKGEHDGVH